MFNSLFWERWHPFLFSLMSFFGAYAAGFFNIKLPESENFFVAIITLGGVFSAFSVTIKSLLLSKDDKVKSLKENDYFDVMVKYLKSSIDSSLILCLLGFLGFFDFIQEISFFLPVTVGCFVFSLLALRRVTTSSTAILRQTKRKKAG